MNNPTSQVGLTAVTSDVGSFVGFFFDSATFCEVSSARTSNSSSEVYPSVDASSETWSLLPVTPTIRRIFALELEATLVSSENRKILNKVDQDAPFSCPRRDCHDVLPNREAYESHAHIHILHDG